MKIKTRMKPAIFKIAKILCERYYLNERDAEDAARSAYRISRKKIK